MPQNWQEWLALAVVAFTIGLLLGRRISRWINQSRQANDRHADCDDCPSSKPPPQTFKNIPISLDKQNKTPHEKLSDK